MGFRWIGDSEINSHEAVALVRDSHKHTQTRALPDDCHSLNVNVLQKYRVSKVPDIIGR